MRSLSLIVLAVLLSAPVAGAQDLHRDIQAVDANGNPTHPKVGAAINPADQIVLEGIVLNNPEDILDPTAAYGEQPWDLGGQWQIYVQADTPGDFGGTACWMGQNYGNLPWVGFPFINNYSDAEWNAEMDRLNVDGGHEIRQGDLVRITGYGLGYGGKSNINERHSKSALNDFTVEYLGSSPGLPAPDVIDLENVKDAGDGFLFDPMRLTGGEHYQGSLVRINDVSFADDSGWGADGTVTVTDGTGRTLPVKLGTDAAFDVPHNLPGTFDLVGIFDQEDGDAGDGWTDGYRLWVTGYDGSTGLLGRTDWMEGDVNDDGVVDAEDIDLVYANAGSGQVVYDLDGDDDVDADDAVYLIENLARWFRGVDSGVGTRVGDFDLNGLVNGTDLAIMRVAFGDGGDISYAEGNANGDAMVDATDLAILKSTFGSQAPSSAPEPALALLISLGWVGILRRRRR